MKKIRSSLFIQLIIFFIAIMALFFMLFFEIHRYAERMLHDKTVAMNEKILLQIENNIQDNYDFICHVAISYAYAPSVYDYFTKNSRERVIATTDISEVEVNIVLLENNIFGLYMYDKNGNLISTLGNNLPDCELDQHPDNEFRFSNIQIQGNHLPYFTVTYPVFDLQSRQYEDQIGSCVFFLKSKSFFSVLDDSQATEHTQVFLLDGNNYVITQKGTDALSYLPDELQTSGYGYYVQKKNLGIEGWKIVSRIPEQEMKSSGENLLHYITICFLIAFLFLGIYVYFTYRHLVLPLRRVDQFIQRLVTSPSERLQIEREDEIGNVVISLNQMLDKTERMSLEIQESQKKIYETELAQKQLQILAYRSQINPHFLYNTFDCIRAMALFYDVDCIAEITMALSHVFRFSVKGGNLASVEAELQYIREYAKIIHFRFNQKIKIRVTCDESILTRQIPKLILQPLVENAVFHGMKDQADGGDIDVNVKALSENRILFRVKDTGCGLSPERQKEIQDSLLQKTEHDGIGIINIYQRLQLFYGNQMRFQIISSPGNGTEIQIEVPDTPIA